MKLLKFLKIKNLAATAFVLQAATCSGDRTLAYLFGFDSEIPQLNSQKVTNPCDPNAGGSVGACAITVGAGVLITGIALKKDHNNNPGQQVVISDGRLKSDIHLLATLDSGMKIYSFKYLWSDTTYVGVMAQDLLANPAWRDAVVTSPNGFYAVNYGTLGLKMVTLEEWKAQGLASIKGGERMSVTKQPQALQPVL